MKGHFLNIPIHYCIIHLHALKFKVHSEKNEWNFLSQITKNHYILLPKTIIHWHKTEKMPTGSSKIPGAVGTPEIYWKLMDGSGRALCGKPLSVPLIAAQPFGVWMGRFRTYSATPVVRKCVLYGNSAIQ